jgi:hypothetical protein
MNMLAKMLAISILNLYPTLMQREQERKERRKKRKNETQPENIPQEVLDKMPLGFRILLTCAYKDGFDFEYEPDNSIIKMYSPLDEAFTSFEAETGKCTDLQKSFLLVVLRHK